MKRTQHLNDPRVDPSAAHTNAICSASRYGHVEVVKLLLNDSRVDPSAASKDALRFALED
jgi:hypothetical protein